MTQSISIYIFFSLYGRVWFPWLLYVGSHFHRFAHHFFEYKSHSPSSMLSYGNWETLLKMYKNTSVQTIRQDVHQLSQTYLEENPKGNGKITSQTTIHHNLLTNFLLQIWPTVLALRTLCYLSWWWRKLQK